MSPADLLMRLGTLTPADAPALVRDLRADLGHATPEDGARALGWGGDLLGIVRDVEEGREPPYEWGYEYVIRGLVALWMFRCGGWRNTDCGNYERPSDGAEIHGGASGHWCTWRDRRRPPLHERWQDGDIDGPVVRKGVLRLMLRIEAQVEARG